MSIQRPCLECGVLSAASYCDEHKRTTRPRTAARRERERTRYGRGWRQLSKKARQMQPFCETCGSTEDLTTEHLPSSIERLSEGLPARLEDVTVLCRAHNSSRAWERAR